MPIWRLKILQSVFLLFGLLVILRLFYWQVISGEKLQAMAESQHFSKAEIPAQRGQIFASDGFPLATNRQTYLLFAISLQIKISKDEIASKLAAVLRPEEAEKSESDIIEKLNRPGLVWVPLARDLSQITKEQIEGLEIKGLGFEEYQQRFYPEASMSAHLLGFVGQDAGGQNKGYFGLEGYYDRSLAGKAGFLKQELDASGKPILIGKTSLSGEISGRDLELSLDRGIQFMVEEKLKVGMERYQASGGLAVLMDPKTGAILSMASFPSYDPAEYGKTDKSLFSNPVISQTFEPGSIFKPLVMASAIDTGVIKPEDKCTKCTGPRQIGEYTIRTWDEQYHPDTTMTEILVHSDNVGMVFVGEKLGSKNLLSYLEKFGLWEQTGIDLEGEMVAQRRQENDWTPIDFATVSFGQGVAVTPIQMVRAISVIANGGLLVEPHVVSKIKSGDKELETKTRIDRRVISETTAKVVTEMMVTSAEKGGRWERPKGYRIAGKTGTAQIPLAGHYDKTKTIVSFVGFAPADNPRFVMLVTLREPALTWGSMTVAPLWFDIASDLFVYLKIPPSY
ncbi:MAG: penicillin-binding protein 2 [bacterium]|nr:penicillin-binding protein 2 [bacterium]